MTATATNSNMTGTHAVNAEQNAEPKVVFPVDSDSGKEILDRINKTVEEHSLDSLKKNLNMTQISEIMPSMFTKYWSLFIFQIYKTGSISLFTFYRTGTISFFDTGSYSVLDPIHGRPTNAQICCCCVN